MNIMNLSRHVPSEKDSLPVFCFASKNDENIRRGVESRTWAVSNKSTGTRRGKAKKNFSVGSRGLLYSTQRHSFTTPFLATSTVDPLKVICDIWPEAWILPFGIEPLGGVDKQLPADAAVDRWPFLRERMGRGGVPVAFSFTGTMVFTPNWITEADWQLILRDLAYPERPPQGP